MDWKSASSWLGGAAAGLAGMYLLDPQQGRRRRSLVKDKAVHVGHEVADASGVIARDMGHRLVGAASGARSRLSRGGSVTPRRLEERARAALGRVVSHPGSIVVHAGDGTLTVSGYIVKDEVAPLLAVLRAVPGVTHVENHLEVGRNPAAMPSLQGGRQRPGLVPDLFQQRMAPATRVWVGAGAISLTSWGLRRRDWLGGILSLFGLASGLRAATNLPFRRIFGIGGRAGVQVQNTIEVVAPVGEVFEFFRHFENFPRFMQHIRRIRKSEGDTWHWEAEGPVGSTVSWDAAITRIQSNRLISWKSVPGSVIGNVGTVWFEPTRHGSTRVHINMRYNPPAGAIGHAVSSLLGADPVRQMDEDLVRFKSLIEKGRTSAKGQQVTREEIAQGR